MSPIDILKSNIDDAIEVLNRINEARKMDYEDYSELFDAIYTISNGVSLSPVGPWHSVKDELPEPVPPADSRNHPYLVYADGYLRVADYTCDKYFPTCYSFHVNGEEETGVTHWMSIEAPKEKE